MAALSDRYGTEPSDRDGASAASIVDLSVVIPTYNRCDRLRRVLNALNEQQLQGPHGSTMSFEVIVVSDGSTDGTSEMVEELDTSFDLQLLVQPNAGPAAARNLGAASANAEVIVFIDDDVVPRPTCLASHYARHRLAPNLVVIGPMLTPDDANLLPWIEWEQFQLYKQYRKFGEGERAYPRQFYTGNASVRRSAFERAGGFDTDFRRAEDVELAERLAELGQAFVFEPRAEGFHYAERSLDSWLLVAFDYGRHDVTFTRGAQPWMRDMIADRFNTRNMIARSVIRWTMARPGRAERACNIATRGALAFDRAGSGTPTRKLLSVAYGLKYYEGVVAQLGSAGAFQRYVGRSVRPASESLSALLVLEQTLGHVTHSSNLQAIVPTFDDVQCTFVEVDASLTGPQRFVPGWSNWTVRAGVRARRSVRRIARVRQGSVPDAMFVHSQVPAVLLGRWMNRIPTVVSVDTTPRQYDELGDFYAHGTGPRLVEKLKQRANVRCFSKAAHVITWSEWAKAGLVHDYGVSGERVTVIPPGVDVDRWAERQADADEGPLRVLFVGGDLERKGGGLLLEAARRLRSDRNVPEFEVHIVTGADVAPEAGIVVHHGLSPNSESLIELYRRAHMFCLPTYGDCLPMVLAEAGAAGLPLIATDVGAIHEVVRDGRTGLLIAPGDVEQLTDALRALLLSGELRDRLGREARALVERDHDATHNARRLVDVMQRAAGDFAVSGWRGRADNVRAVLNARWRLRNATAVGSASDSGAAR